MAVPAILFIESGRPLNYIAAQFMVFSGPIAEPFLQAFFNIHDYDTFRQALERRENVENLLLKIEKYDAQMAEWERDIKNYLKKERKNWKWYQRYLGIFTPKVNYPEELRMPAFVREDEEEKMKKKNKDWRTRR
jgi:hypothetical protein